MIIKTTKATTARVGRTTVFKALKEKLDNGISMKFYFTPFLCILYELLYMKSIFEIRIPNFCYIQVLKSVFHIFS